MTLEQSSTEVSVDPLAAAEQALQELPSLAPLAREQRRAEIIQLCVPWARREAARYRHSGEPLEDLVQVALVGLILAVDRYDASRAYRSAISRSPPLPERSSATSAI